MRRSDPKHLRAMVSADGYRVEPILVQRSLRRPPRAALRITWRGYFMADCATVTEVAEHVDLDNTGCRSRGEPRSAASGGSRGAPARGRGGYSLRTCSRMTSPSQNGGQLLVLDRDETVVDEPRRVVVM